MNSLVLAFVLWLLFVAAVSLIVLNAKPPASIEEDSSHAAEPHTAM
jgi:hypothetical protein